MAKKEKSDKVVNTQVSLNVKEAKDFLRHIFKNNQFLQESGKKPVSVEVISDAGIGKTSIIEQLSQEMGCHFVKLNLAQMEEVENLVGFPLKEFEVCRGTEKCEWIPEHALDQYLKLGFTFTGNKRASYAIPEWIEGKEEGGILLLDDAWRADPRFVNAVMEIN